MEVLILQVFVSLMLVLGSVLLFAKSVRERDYEHSDRLALFPIARDDAKPAEHAADTHLQPENQHVSSD